MKWPFIRLVFMTLLTLGMSNKSIANPQKLILENEPRLSENENGISISFSVRNSQYSSMSVNEATIRLKNVSNDRSVATINNTDIERFTVGSNSVYLIADHKFLEYENYQQLDIGAYVVSLEYRIGDAIYTLPLSFFRKFSGHQLDTYEVNRHSYFGVPIYALRGGMSAEYAVQKSLASLKGGISHTWDVRVKLDGQLDLPGGGPVSVYSSRDFLKKSLEKTVALYDNELGANASFNTVIISTGVPSVPYLSYYMGAPVLPLHFLVAVNSFSEIQTIVHSGINEGYSCYATAGYDPSIEAEGVAWIKLLDLPNEYKEFLIKHKVKNVIILGAKESGFGETQARRIKFKFPVDNPGTYEEGSVYVMTHGGDEGLSNLRNYFKDYDRQIMEPQRSISDWESGITQVQINRFENTIYNIDPIDPIGVYVIEGSESIGFYNISMDLTLEFWKKNSEILGSDPINSIAMNEYLIGYPAYESRSGQIPMLYWQMPGNEKNTSARVNNLLKYKIKKAYPHKGFNAIPVKFNAKFNRLPFVSALRDIGMANVTQNSWQKADVWDPSDGMESPCEIAAKVIVNTFGGASAFRNWTASLTELTINDLKNMAINEDINSMPHPEPMRQPTNVATVPEAGLNIKRYEFSAQGFWDSREQLKEIALYDYNTGRGNLLGWIDGFSKTGNQRRQRITISQFDLENTSDEYDLKIGYKFNPKEDNGFNSYNPDLRDEQKMDCFEYTRVPKTSWLDIPSRVMAREGALWIVNGSVYDWDYNGIPGVVPFIKKNGVVKAQPQILSYKGEGVFAWHWGAKKSVDILGRSKDISSNNLVNQLSTLFQNETSGYPNVLAGMTFMDGGNSYDIKNLQPQWMLDYPDFNPKHLGPSGTSIRCFLSNPDPNACTSVLEKAWGVVEFAPDEEGWNDCTRLVNNNDVKRFSTLAYRQYDKLFERVPNARTYVAIKGNKLDIGLIDGNLGNFSDPRGVNYSKSFGMKNSEVSKFYQYKGYDKLINLDGGSSSQMWFNGRGPLHDWTGYPLIEDNQGPYYSRLVSSYLMLVPKKHTEQIGEYNSTNNQYLILDNSEMTFDYDDKADHDLDKSFVSLSPSKNLLTESAGLIAGNFKVENPEAKGAILYYQGEDTYYEDTEGLEKVVPRMRNILIIGVGKIPEYVLETFKGKPMPANIGNNENLQELLNTNKQGFYLLKMMNGSITQYKFENNANYNKYLDNTWHSFMICNGIHVGNQWKFSIKVDDREIAGMGTDDSTLVPDFGGMFAMGVITHAAIGAANIDGRFVTGNAKLAIDNYLFVNGSIISYEDLSTISSSLTTERRLPDLISNEYYTPEVYALQFEETKGMHSFALAKNPNDVRLYGLNLNTERVQNSITELGLNPAKINSGDYYLVNNNDQCLTESKEEKLAWTTYKDSEGNTRWNDCRQISVIDESNLRDNSTQYDRSLKLKDDKYLDLEKDNIQIHTFPIGNQRVFNNALKIESNKTILIPYQISNRLSDNSPISVAFIKNNMGSFSYQLISAPNDAQPATTSGASSVAHSVKHKYIIKSVIGAGAGIGGIGTGIGIGAYLWNKKASILRAARRGYSKLSNTETEEIELKEKCE